MKKIFLTLLISISFSTFGQFKATGYFDKEIGLSYQFSKKLQTEIRINDDINSDFSSEISVLYAFISKENYNFNSGIGLSLYPFSSTTIDFLESIYIPFQIEISPLKSTKNLALVLESAYHFSTSIYASGVRNSVGIRYIFN